jgi:hypothetical protein
MAEDGDEERWVPLLDVTQLSIRELAASDDNSALAMCIRRLVRSLDDPNGIISAFQSFISE